MLSDKIFRQAINAKRLADRIVTCRAEALRKLDNNKEKQSILSYYRECYPNCEYLSALRTLTPDFDDYWYSPIRGIDVMYDDLSKKNVIAIFTGKDNEKSRDIISLEYVLLYLNRHQELDVYTYDNYGLDPVCGVYINEPFLALNSEYRYLEYNFEVRQYTHMVRDSVSSKDGRSESFYYCYSFNDAYSIMKYLSSNEDKNNCQCHINKIIAEGDRERQRWIVIVDLKTNKLAVPSSEELDRVF